MKSRLHRFFLFVLVLGLLPLLSRAATTGSSSPPPAALTSTWTSLSDGKWILRNGVTYYILSTDGSIFVKTAYLNGGGSSTLIPFTEWGYDVNASYSFESVTGSGVVTGSSVSGSGSSIAVTPGYGRFDDAYTGNQYGPHGCMVLKGSSPGTFSRYWSKWAEASFMADGGKWLTAEYGGGNDVAAKASVAGPWEEFRLCTNSSDFWNHMTGTIESGDTIAMLSVGPQWVTAEAGVLDTVVSKKAIAGLWEHFTISKTSGSGAIGTNDDVSVKAHSSNKYWVAEYGGGTVVRANRTSVGPWETFTMLFH